MILSFTFAVMVYFSDGAGASVATLARSSDTAMCLSFPWSEVVCVPIKRTYFACTGSSNPKIIQPVCFLSISPVAAVCHLSPSRLY